jgi:hypothetical protein
MYKQSPMETTTKPVLKRQLLTSFAPKKPAVPRMHSFQIMVHDAQPGKEREKTTGQYHVARMGDWSKAWRENRAFFGWTAQTLCRLANGECQPNIYSKLVTQTVGTDEDGKQKRSAQISQVNLINHIYWLGRWHQAAALRLILKIFLPELESKTPEQARKVLEEAVRGTGFTNLL